MADVLWRLPTSLFNEKVKFDADSRSVSVVEVRERMAHLGFLFYAFVNELNVAEFETRYILLRTGALPPHLRGIDIAALTGPINASIYERDAPVDLGSPEAEAKSVFNANRNSSNTPGSELWSFGNVVPASPLGNEFVGSILLPTTAKDSGVTGGTRSNRIVLRPNNDYLIGIFNGGKAANTINLFFEWFEIPWT